MTTKRQKWAMKRNWLIKRLKGAQSIFSYDNQKFMKELSPVINHRFIDNTESYLHFLIKEISKSKYKE